MAYMGIIPEAPSFSTQLARGLGGGLGSGLSRSAEFAQQMALQKQKSSSLAKETKQLEKIKIMETGLGTIEKMKELLPFAGGWTSGPFNKIQGLIPGETQKKRSELESLGRSLIPLVSEGVPIRNQKEFEEYKKVITDPNASPSQLEGALDAIQNILERSIDHDEESPRNKQKFSSDHEPMVKIMAPDGTRGTVPKSRVKDVLKAGGKVIK